MNTHKMTQFTIIVVCLALAGCASTGAATPIGTQPPQQTIPSVVATAPSETLGPTATRFPISTPHPTAAPSGIERPTRTPRPTIAPTPQNTLVPIATNYPDPPVSLSPTGPWLVFRDRDNRDYESDWNNGYLWAINQDGTGLTRLTNETASTFAIRPTSSVQDGLTIAYGSRNFNSYNTNGHENTIKLLSWPGGDAKTIVYNLSDRVAWLEWSPSGSKLAFVSAMGDTSLNNVFVYDTATEQSTRVAVTEERDFNLRWSPDERYVIFETYYIDSMGSSLDGYAPTGVWSARADAGGITQLAHGPHSQNGWSVEYLRWLSSTEILLGISQWTKDWEIEIRITNIETGSYTTLIGEPFLNIAYSPEHNLFLMTKEAAPVPNRLLVFYQNGERREVTGYTIKQVEWLSAHDVFLGQTPNGRVYLISPNGIVTEIPSPEWKVESPHHVMVSPDGQWWVWHNSFYLYQGDSELWVGPAMTQPSVLLSYSEPPPDFRVYPGDIKWSPDSQHLLWLTVKGLYHAQAPDFDTVFVTQLSSNWWRTSPGPRGNGATFSDAVWVQ